MEASHALLMAGLRDRLFSRDAENSSREIVAPNTNAPDEFVAERVFSCQS